MDVETTQAIEELRSRVDQLEVSLRGEMAALRFELRSEIAEFRGEVRGDIGTLRAELRDGLALNWSRTQLLIEDVRGDIRLLADAIANKAARKSPVTDRGQPSAGTCPRGARARSC